jgi:hypothetical protein
MSRYEQPNFRIITSEGKIKFAGTGYDSWFTLAKAREVLEDGDSIYEYPPITGNRLWEGKTKKIMLNFKNFPQYRIGVLEETSPSQEFDGLTNFIPNGWDLDRHNEATLALKRGWSLFQICEINTGELFYISSISVIQFTESNHLKVHPAETAMYFAQNTVKVYTVAAKGFNAMFSVNSISC